jgi:hypothetical protein
VRAYDIRDGGHTFAVAARSAVGPRKAADDARGLCFRPLAVGLAETHQSRIFLLVPLHALLPTRERPRRASTPSCYRGIVASAATMLKTGINIWAKVRSGMTNPYLQIKGRAPGA